MLRDPHTTKLRRARLDRGWALGVDSLINRELAKRLAILKEIAFLNGRGHSAKQPRGDSMNPRGSWPTWVPRPESSPQR
jgi:hypothetical protein